MTTFVLVPGACHGGWWYEELVEALAERGHLGVPLTLAGLGPRDEPTGVNLETHVAETVAAVEQQRTDDLVLVGHSYGGSVITGAADRLQGNIKALIYLDAFVPEDGDSCFSMTNDEQRRWYVDGAGDFGFAIDPLPFFDVRARPHPLATLIQRSRLTGAWRAVPGKHYAAAQEWPQGDSPFTATTQRLQQDPDWQVTVWDTRHNVLHDGPDRVLDLLLRAIA
jgi:pimeloyl-ACP methyl ester carboxylesterase